MCMQFYSNEELGPFLPLVELLAASADHLGNAARELVGLEDLTPRDSLDMTHDALVAWAASDTVESQCTATAKAAHPAAFHGVPPSKLFFLVACFMECGRAGRSRLLKKAHCNAVLPTTPAFQRAFQCNPNHLLVTNFTWPDLSPEDATAENCSVSA
ncbi:uncharacterized protein LOC144093486 [Amblyomma americanum]